MPHTPDQRNPTKKRARRSYNRVEPYMESDEGKNSKNPLFTPITLFSTRQLPSYCYSCRKLFQTSPPTKPQFHAHPYMIISYPNIEIEDLKTKQTSVLHVNEIKIYKVKTPTHHTPLRNGSFTSLPNTH